MRGAWIPSARVRTARWPAPRWRHQQSRATAMPSGWKMTIGAISVAAASAAQRATGTADESVREITKPSPEGEAGAVVPPVADRAVARVGGLIRHDKVFDWAESRPRFRRPGGCCCDDPFPRAIRGARRLPARGNACRSPDGGLERARRLRCRLQAQGRGFPAVAGDGDRQL